MAQLKKGAKALLEQKLIEAVKTRPCIYSIAHPDHKNSIVVENSWTSIFNELGGATVFTNGK